MARKIQILSCRFWCCSRHWNRQPNLVIPYTFIDWIHRAVISHSYTMGCAHLPFWKKKYILSTILSIAISDSHGSDDDDDDAMEQNVNTQLCLAHLELSHCALNRVYSICNIDSSAHAFRLRLLFFPRLSVCMGVRRLWRARVYSNLNRQSEWLRNTIQRIARPLPLTHTERMIPFRAYQPVDNICDNIRHTLRLLYSSTLETFHKNKTKPKQNACVYIYIYFD